MSVVTIIKEVKAIHPENIAIIKIGKFYNVYLQDAYIISYLFGYKLREVERDVKSCGFPEMSLNKVIATLENKKINYMLIDRRNNYEIDEVFDLGTLNQYKEIYSKAKKQANLNARIDNITKYLYENINKKEISSILKKMELAIYE